MRKIGRKEKERQKEYKRERERERESDGGREKTVALIIAINMHESLRKLNSDGSSGNLHWSPGLVK